MKKLKKSDWLLVFIFIVLFIFLHWNNFNMPLERDEGEYAYSAWLMKQGKMPYQSAFIQKPPLIIYTYVLAQLVPVDGYWAPRLLAYFPIVGTIIFLGLIASKLWGKTWGWVSVFLSTGFLANPYILPFTANTEIFMMWPLTGVLALYVFKRSEAGYISWFISGCLAALALLFKPIALFFLFFLFGVWFWEQLREKISFVKLVLRVLIVLLGGSLVTALTLLPFWLKGLVGEIWQMVVVFNSQYLSSGHFGWDHTLRYWGYFWQVWKLPSLLLLTLALLWPKRTWFYLGLLLVSVLAVYRSDAGHYFLLLIPGLTLATVLALKTVLTKFKDPKIQAKSNLIALLSVIVLLASFFVPRGEMFTMTTHELSWWMFGFNTPFVESRAMSKIINQRTKPHDKVFVLGSEPQILFYAQRESASRFVIVNPLIIETDFRLNYQLKTIEELKKNLPKLILVSELSTSGAWDLAAENPLLDYLDVELAQNFERVGCWARQTHAADYGQWQEEVEEVEKCSLVLFRRKS
ncbi:ArnT family glycosyltransferase [Patescibacteria group bacterium]